MVTLQGRCTHVVGVVLRLTPSRPSVYLRSLEQTSIDDAAVQRHPLTDSPSFPSPQSIPAPTGKQIGSVPAVGSGPGAAKIDEEDIASANTEPPKPLSSTAPAFSTNTSSFLADASPLEKAPTRGQIGSVPAVGSGASAAKIDEKDIASANTEPPEPLATTAPAFATTTSPSLAVSSSFVTAPATKQIGSVPAVGSGPGAAKIDEKDIASANTEPPEPLSTAPSTSATTTVLSPLTSSSPLATNGEALVDIYSKQTSNKPANGTDGGAATLAVQEIASAKSESSGPSSTPALVPSTTSSLGKNEASLGNITSKRTGLVQSQASNKNSSVAATSAYVPKLSSSADSSTLPPSSDQPVAPVVTNIAEAGTSNVAMAGTFNAFFDSMNANSACNPNSDTQRMVCIDRKIARCGPNGRYTLSACSQNQICRAVPLDGGRTGIAILCVPAAEIAPSQPAPPSPTASGALPLESKSTPSNSTNGSETSTVTSQETATPIQNPSASSPIEPSSSTPVEAGTAEIRVTPIEGPKSPEADPSKSSPLSSPVIATTEATPTTPSLENAPPTIIIKTHTQIITSAAGGSSTSPVPEGSQDIPTSSLDPALPSASAPTPEPPAIVIIPQSRKQVETVSSEPNALSSVYPDAPAITNTPAQVLNASGATGQVTVTEMVTVTATVTEKL